MSFFERLSRQLSFLLRQPEVRIFWILIAPLAALIAINLIYLPAFVALLANGVTVAAGAVVFFAAARTARLHGQVSLERNELKSVVYSLQEALIVYDTSFHISFINPAAERLFGLHHEHIVGRIVQPADAADPSLTLFVQVIYPSLAPTMIPQSPAGEYPQTIDLSFGNPPVELRVVTSPIRDQAGSTLGFMKIVRDRTREISIIKSKNEFITVASHQLRQPMTEITWALETLSANKSLDENAKAIVTNTLMSSRALVKITEDLLNIAKIEEGRFGYVFESVDVVSFIDEVLAPLAASVKQAGITLYFERPQTVLSPVIVDKKKLSIALTNLVENAVRYNVQNGQVIVKAAATKGSYVAVSVSDTGIGIPPEDVEKLFTKFFRAANAVRFETQGSGLGLYITKNIIYAHGGTIEVTSEINRGTTFTFTLPTDPSLVPSREVPFGY